MSPGLLLPEQSPQGNRQMLHEHVLEHDGLFHAKGTVDQHAGQHLGRLPNIQRVGLVEHFQLLMVGQVVGSQKMGHLMCHRENLLARYPPRPSPGPESSPAWLPEEDRIAALRDDGLLPKFSLSKSKPG